MRGIYTNDKNEIVYVGGRKPEDKGFTWHELSSQEYSALIKEDLKSGGHYRFAYVDGKVVETNVSEILAFEARQKRDRLLAETDVYALPDHPKYSEAILQYRQALRDVPQQSGFPEKIDWPESPI